MSELKDQKMFSDLPQDLQQISQDFVFELRKFPYGSSLYPTSETGSLMREPINVLDASLKSVMYRPDEFERFERAHPEYTKALKHRPGYPWPYGSPEYTVHDMSMSCDATSVLLIKNLGTVGPVSDDDLLRDHDTWSKWSSRFTTCPDSYWIARFYLDSERYVRKLSGGIG